MVLPLHVSTRSSARADACAKKVVTRAFIPKINTQEGIGDLIAKPINEIDQSSNPAICRQLPLPLNIDRLTAKFGLAQPRAMIHFASALGRLIFSDHGFVRHRRLFLHRHGLSKVSPLSNLIGHSRLPMPDVDRGVATCRDGSLADISPCPTDVRFVSQADLSRRSKKVHYSITSSAEMRLERAQPLD